MWLLTVLFLLFFIFYLIDRKYQSEYKAKESSDYFESSIKTQKTSTSSYEPVDFIFIPSNVKQAYLHSKEWHKLRLARLNYDHYSCCKCSAIGVSLEVHHLHYQTFGNESIEDLASLCRDCHQSIHDKYGYDYNNQFPVKD